MTEQTDPEPLRYSEWSTNLRPGWYPEDEDDTDGDTDPNDWEPEHDPDCPCEACQDERIETRMMFDLGELP